MSAELDREYQRIRKNLLQQRRYYIKRGIPESNLPKIPAIPKTITEASIRRLKGITVNPYVKQLKQELKKYANEVPTKTEKTDTILPYKYTSITFEPKSISKIQATEKNIKKIHNERKELKKARKEFQSQLESLQKETEKTIKEYKQKREQLSKPPKEQLSKPEEVLPKPIDPYDDSYWEDWEEGPPRNYEAEEQEVIDNLKKSHPEMFYPAEEDVVTDNMEETLIDFGLYDMVDEELSMWGPKETWTPATQSKKARDVDSALSIFYGAVDSDGKAVVAQRLNEYGADIQHILDAICYDSDQENVRFNLNQFASIVRNKAISLEDNMRLTESSELYR